MLFCFPSAEVKYGEVVAELSAGFFFGESALVNDTPRASTCLANGNVRDSVSFCAVHYDWTVCLCAACQVECWQLSRADFTSAAGKMEHLIGAYIRRMQGGELPEALGFAKHVSTFSAQLAAIRADHTPSSMAVPRTSLCGAAVFAVMLLALQ